MIEADRSLINSISCYNEVLPLVNNLTDYWSVIKQMPKMDRPDKGTIYSLKLQKLAPKLMKFYKNYVLHCSLYDYLV